MTKKKVAKKARNTKVYPIEYILEKKNLTPNAFTELGERCLTDKHIIPDEGITHAGYMTLCREIKKNEREAVQEVVQAEKDAPIIRKLRILEFRPPNKSKLYCADEIEGQEPSKVVVNAPPKFVEGAKTGVYIECERIADGLFTYPPLERD